MPTSIGSRATSRIEVLCNRFAGVFLVPREALAGALRGRNLDPQAVQEIARHFNVSQLVIYCRLLDTHRIDQATYNAAHQRAQERPSPKSPEGGDYYNTQLAYLGRPFVEMALKQYRRQRITEEQLADYLNVKPKNLATLEERFLRGAGDSKPHAADIPNICQHLGIPCLPLQGFMEAENWTF
jgi:hypothetical protein